MKTSKKLNTKLRQELDFSLCIGACTVYNRFNCTANMYPGSLGKLPDVLHTLSQIFVVELYSHVYCYSCPN